MHFTALQILHLSFHMEHWTVGTTGSNKYCLSAPDKLRSYVNLASLTVTKATLVYCNKLHFKWCSSSDVNSRFAFHRDDLLKWSTAGEIAKDGWFSGKGWRSFSREQIAAIETMMRNSAKESATLLDSKHLPGLRFARDRCCSYRFVGIEIGRHNSKKYTNICNRYYL
jgi:hypothetical protein